jgi:hypothetical protein
VGDWFVFRRLFVTSTLTKLLPARAASATTTSTLDSQPRNHVFSRQRTPPQCIQAPSIVNPVFVIPRSPATTRSNLARCHLRIPLPSPLLQQACKTWGFPVAIPPTSASCTEDLSSIRVNRATERPVQQIAQHMQKSLCLPSCTVASIAFVSHWSR